MEELQRVGGGAGLRPEQLRPVEIVHAGWWTAQEVSSCTVRPLLRRMRAKDASSTSKGLPRIDLAQAPGAVAQAARAEFGVGLAGHRDGFELAHQIERLVEHVHSDVIGAAAAGEFPLGEP